MDAYSDVQESCFFVLDLSRHERVKENERKEIWWVQEGISGWADQVNDKIC